QTYALAAHALHQQLLAPLGELPKRLIFVPSGILGYVPFEVLLTEAPEDPLQFKQLPYLLRQHQVSYNFSAALWQEMKQNKATKARELHLLAPSFSTTPQYASAADYRRDNLGPLQFNTEEVSGIQSIIGGTIWMGTAATKAQFLAIAPQARLLHFATHAKLDDQDEDFSYLAFASTTDSLAAEKLYIRELYAQKIPAELVVLSACETGVGTIQEGEGIISLARGFAYAGAGSIVTSLWAVDDQSTARIMTNFYTYLNQGLSKDEALRQTKLDYLDAAGDQLEAHPFKWAPFIIIGNADVIDLSSGIQNLPLWALLGGLLLLGGAGFLWFRKRSSAKGS
ncbi:MAG: CHAT domain-containing protein, partial [Phaeodactylibacter sp.]|nr:CHAT domain-containing protein [Phaeodactylibacter sp.]